MSREHHNAWFPHHFGLERGLHFSPLQRIPVHAFEEGLHPDVSHHAESASGISLKQLQKGGEDDGR